MKRGNRIKIRKIISFVMVAAGIIAVGLYIYLTVRDKVMLDKGRDFYSSLAEQMDETANTGVAPVVYPEEKPTEDRPADNTPDSPEEAQEEAEFVHSGPSYDINALRDGLYSDLVGWIKCPGTNIDYPVAQGTDNDFYLSHLIDGTANKTGSIFMDYRNSADLSDKHTLIYGHHIKNGDMFGVLESYNNQSFYDEHPVIELYMQDGDYSVLLFAGYVVDASAETVPLRFGSTEDFARYIEEVRGRSVFTSDVTVVEDDRLVSFCTCTYTFKNARLILVGKLMPRPVENLG